MSQKIPDKDLRYLLKIPFLAPLREKERRPLLEKAVFSHHEKGSYLFEEGDPIDSIYILSQGTVKLSRIDNAGREQIIGIFSSQETIWESMFIEHARYPYSAVCLEDTDVWRLARNEFENILRNPETSMSIIIMLSKKLRDANRRNLVLTTRDPLQRVAAFIIYRLEQGMPGYTPSGILLTLDDIAGSVNLRPETVSRKIRILEDEGMIRRFGRSGIRVTDYVRLRELSGLQQ